MIRYILIIENILESTVGVSEVNEASHSGEWKIAFLILTTKPSWPE